MPADAAELLTLQRACWVQEQQANPGVEIPAHQEGLADVQAWLQEWTTLVLRAGGRLIGAARAHRVGETWDIGRHHGRPGPAGQRDRPAAAGRDRGAAPEEVREFVLFTGAGSARNIRMYKKAGYRLVGADPEVPGAVRLTKRRR